MVEILSRIQFAFSVGFHFLFVPLSIGLIFLVCLYEFRYMKSDDRRFKALSEFYGDMFVINYAFGIVTGFTMSLQFGTNWSAYSVYMGDVFGAPLVFEAMIAFFLESTFTGIWIFKKNKMSKRLRFLTVVLIFIGTNFSALWIITANGFMQNPVGYTFEAKYKAEIPASHLIAASTVDVAVSSKDANDSTFVTNSGITYKVDLKADETALKNAKAQISAKDTKGDKELFKKRLKSTSGFDVSSLDSNEVSVQVDSITGDNLITQSDVASGLVSVSGKVVGFIINNKDKVTISVDGNEFETKLTGKRVVVKDFRKILLNPYVWYMLLHNNLGCILLGAYFVLAIGGLRFLKAKKLGDEEEAESFRLSLKPANIVLVITSLLMPAIGYAYFNYIVPIQETKISAIEGDIPLVSISFALMVGLGTFFIVFSIYTLIFFKKFTESPVMQKLYMWTFALPYIAIIAGWIVAEVGRQPYVVYGQMLTKDAVSNVPEMQVWFSLITILVMYAILAVACVYLIRKRIKAPLVKQEQ